MVRPGKFNGDLKEINDLYYRLNKIFLLQSIKCKSQLYEKEDNSTLGIYPLFLYEWKCPVTSRNGYD